MARVHTSRTLASRVLTIFAAIALLVAFIVPVGADDVVEIQAGTPEAAAGDQIQAEGFSSWFVELGTPTADGASAAQAAADKKQFRDNAARKGIAYSERYAYSDLFNGLSITASGDSLAKIRSIPGVKNVWPVVTESLPTGTGAGEVIDLSTAIEMTGAKYAQDTLGLTGRNVKVAIMDTGVDYHHPDLGGCFAADGCRVIRGWDFVGNAFNADSTSPTYNPVTVPDSDPDDCNGHGTHVAGIVGANGAVVGVAPNVKFGAYRVFGCGGSTTSDIMLAAMERALHDNMDVLNMSIGSSLQWPQYPTAAAADRLVTKKGIVVVASIGNSGPGSSAPLGLYAAGAPGVGANVIGVASFDNTHNALRVFTVSPDNAQFGYNQATGAPTAPTSGSLPLAKTGTPATANDACNVLPAGSLAGQAVLIRRGTCSFNIKATNAQNAGAAAVIIYNNVAGIQSITVAGPPNVTIPTVSISDTQGVDLNNRIAAAAPGAVTLTWTTGSAKFPSPTANTVSGFSSYGLAADLTLKPDIGAPGGSIYSTVPLEQGGHGNLSGTSMASPHVAGTVALYLEANRSQKAPTVRDILQNSASPRNSPLAPLLDSVHRQGAGMVDIRAALSAGAVVSPGKLSLGEQSGPATRTITLRNISSSDQTYALSSAAGLATGPNTFSISVLSAPSTVTFSSTTVTVAKNSTATFGVTITANPGLADGSLYGGWIILSSTTADSVLRVPYAGFKGDYQGIVVHPATAFRGFARLAPAFAPVPNGTTFTFAGNDTPAFYANFRHQSRNVTFLVRNVATGTTYSDPALSMDYFSRNSATNVVSTFAWDGGVGPAGARTILPNGTYEISMRILKALGDPTNSAHTESAVLGQLTIARP